MSSPLCPPPIAQTGIICKPCVCVLLSTNRPVEGVFLSCLACHLFFLSLSSPPSLSRECSSLLVPFHLHAASAPVPHYISVFLVESFSFLNFHMFCFLFLLPSLSFLGTLAGLLGRFSYIGPYASLLYLNCCGWNQGLEHPR